MDGSLEKIWTITSVGIYSDILLGYEVEDYSTFTYFLLFNGETGGGGRALERETIVGCGQVFKVSLVKRASKASCYDKRPEEALFIQGK